MEELIELEVALSIDAKTEDYIHLSKGEKVTILEDFKAKCGTFTINHAGIMGKVPHLAFNINQHTSNFYLEILNEFLIRPDLLYEMIDKSPNFKLTELFMAKDLIYEILTEMFLIEINICKQQTTLFREITPGLVLATRLYESENVENYKLEFIKFIVDNIVELKKKKLEIDEIVINLIQIGLRYLLKTKIPNEIIIILRAIKSAFEKHNLQISRTYVISHILSFFFLRIISPVLCQTANIKPKSSKIIISKRNSAKILKVSDEDRPFISSKSMEFHLSLNNLQKEDSIKSPGKTLKTLFSPRKSPKEPERDSPKYKSLFKDVNNLQILLCLSKLYQALASNNLPNPSSSIYNIYLKTEHLRELFVKLAELILKTKSEKLNVERSLIYDMSDFYMNFLEYLKNTELEGSKILLMRLLKQYGISYDFDKVYRIDDYIKRQICY